jgi:hypothetical protein
VDGVAAVPLPHVTAFRSRYGGPSGSRGYCCYYYCYCYCYDDDDDDDDDDGGYK